MQNKSIKEIIIWFFVFFKFLNTEGQSNKKLAHCGNFKVFRAVNNQSGKNTCFLIESQNPLVSALGPGQMTISLPLSYLSWKNETNIAEIIGQELQRFYWNTATLIHFYTVYGCFHYSGRAELF